MATLAVLPYNLPELKQLILVKTNIGGWFFDAILKTDHNSELNITSHPIQTGAAITDHAYLEPQELSIDIGMSDSAQSLVSGQFTNGNPSRSINAFRILQELQKQRIPVQVVTRLRIYQNMLIKTISAPDDYTTLHGLKATIQMKEILVSEVTTVKLSVRPQKTDTTPGGNPEVVPPNQSILKQFMNSLYGNGGVN
jgi:hypothetical protein